MKRGQASVEYLLVVVLVILILVPVGYYLFFQRGESATQISEVSAEFLGTSILTQADDIFFRGGTSKKQLPQNAPANIEAMTVEGQRLVVFDLFGDRSDLVYTSEIPVSSNLPPPKVSEQRLTVERRTNREGFSFVLISSGAADACSTTEGVCSDLIDNDCDGFTDDQDLDCCNIDTDDDGFPDGDGFDGDECSSGGAPAHDCDDRDPLTFGPECNVNFVECSPTTSHCPQCIHPFAQEFCEAGGDPLLQVDNNCLAGDELDACPVPGDNVCSFREMSPPGVNCDAECDPDPTVPACADQCDCPTEIHCDDGVDNDGDTDVDYDDCDCFVGVPDDGVCSPGEISPCGDCRDSDHPDGNPGDTGEDGACFDGEDNDNDGDTDGADDDCDSQIICRWSDSGCNTVGTIPDDPLEVCILRAQSNNPTATAFTHGHAQYCDDYTVGNPVGGATDAIPAGSEYPFSLCCTQIDNAGAYSQLRTEYLQSGSCSDNSLGGVRQRDGDGVVSFVGHDAGFNTGVAGDFSTVEALWKTNLHVKQFDDTDGNADICLTSQGSGAGSTNGPTFNAKEINCGVVTGQCPTGDTCLYSFEGTSAFDKNNAHVGTCDAPFDHRVCCSLT